jgi:RNAse (barnase) inhibitor barstar
MEIPTAKQLFESKEELYLKRAKIQNRILSDKVLDVLWDVLVNNNTEHTLDIDFRAYN